MKRARRVCLTIGFFAMPVAHAQSPTTRDLMLDLIHPASNALLLVVNRNGPTTTQEWSAARHSALTLAESGTLLAPIVNSDAWRVATKLFSDAGAEAYKAAQAKDAKALAAATTRIDAACTACHKQFRPNIFPKAGT